MNPSTTACIGLGPVCVPDQASLVVWVEPVLPFTFVGELDRELSCGMHISEASCETTFVGWDLAPYPDIFWYD